MLPLVLPFVCFLLPHAVAAAARPPCTGRVHTFTYGKHPNQLLRLRVEIPKLFLDTFLGTQKELLAAVERILLAAGWRDVQLIMQDPTVPTTFTVLARGRGSLHGEAFEVANVEPVEEPGTRSRPAATTTDPGLTEAETRALGQALVWDTNPKHLSGFAGTFTPHFPIAHALLTAKARILEEGWKPTDRDASFSKLIVASRLLPNAEDVRRMWLVLSEENAGPSVHEIDYAVGAPGDDHGLRRADVDRWVRENRFPPELVDQECLRAMGLTIENAGPALDAFPPSFRALAATCFDGYPGSFLVPDVRVVRRVFPAKGDEGFVSPTALQLAAAEMKPEAAGVARKAGVPAVLHDVASQADTGDPQAMRARAMVEKAEKAIDRARWVDWYESEAKG